MSDLSNTTVLLLANRAVLVDIVDVGRIFSRSWFLDDKGKYLRATVNRRKTTLHRFIAGVTDPTVYVDHRNGEIYDCRRINLRESTPQQNACNRRAPSHGRVGRKGVSLITKTGKYRAEITCNGRRHYIGTFETPEAAESAYQQRADELHGEFAAHRRVTL